MLVHVLATKRMHLLGAMVFEDIQSVVELDSFSSKIYMSVCHRLCNNL